MDKERDSPSIALQLYLSESRRKAVQDVLKQLCIDVEDATAPLHVTKDKSQIHSLGQTDKGDLKQQRMSKVKPDMMLTPSISVTLFLLDKDLQMSKLEIAPQMFARSPWKFHHLMEVNTTSRSTNRIHARQEFYELVPDLPLFTVSTTHFGKQILRFTIATYNHVEMVSFYKNLFVQPGVCVRSNFTYFTFAGNKDLTLQLALKHSAELMPYPANCTDLLVTLDSLPENVQSNQILNNLHLVIDPDENCLLIHISTDHNSFQHTSVPSDLVSSSEKLAISTNNRPDVVPSQDCYITSTPVESPRLTQKAISTKRCSNTPAVEEKKLNFSSIALTSSSRKQMPDRNNNNGHRRRPSIDVLESF